MPATGWQGWDYNLFYDSSRIIGRRGVWIRSLELHKTSNITMVVSKLQVIAIYRHRTDELPTMGSTCYTYTSLVHGKPATKRDCNVGQGSTGQYGTFIYLWIQLRRQDLGNCMFSTFSSHVIITDKYNYKTIKGKINVCWHVLAVITM